MSSTPPVPPSDPAPPSLSTGDWLQLSGNAPEGPTPVFPWSPPAAVPVNAEGGDALPDVPGYELLGELGRGGMGVVYRARHRDLGREVALKMVLNAEFAGPEQRRRFLAEAQVVARLRHPNIVQIYEVGEHGGRPWCALEYLPAGDLARHVRGTPQPAAHAAGVVAQLARGVHAAHQAGIVHRDLKPANVLLAADGTPKVTDFGLAKDLGARTGQTQSGEVMGTPAYMAPEQATGRSKHVGPAADVYSLGAILYELLTGRPPFTGLTPMDVLFQVMTADAPLVTRTHKGVPLDLGTICMKCLDREPARRYATAQALAEDLDRFRAGEPILARRVGELERAWKWARRRPALAGALAVAVLALVLGAGFSLAFAFEAQSKEQQAVSALHAADEARQAAQAAEVRAVQTSHASLRQAAELLFDQGLALAEQGEPGRGQFLMLASLRRLAEVQPATAADEDFRRMVRTNLGTWGEQTPSLRLIVRNKDIPNGVTFSPDGRTFATTGYDGRVRIRDCTSGQVLTELPHPEAVAALAFSPDGKQLLVGGTWYLDKPKQPHSAYLWDLTTNPPRPVGRPLLHQEIVDAVAWHPEGKWVLTGSGDKTVRLWDAATGSPVSPPLPQLNWVFHVAFRPGGQTFLVCDGTTDGNRASGVQLWDTATRTPVGPRLGPFFMGVHGEFSPDGKALVIGTAEGLARCYACATLQPQGPSLQHSAPVLSTRFLPDGRTVITVAQDDVVRLWDRTTGRTIHLLRGHEMQGFHQQTAVSPDGQRLLLNGADWTTRLWDLPRGSGTVVPRGQPSGLPLRGEGSGTFSAAIFSPDRQRVLLPGYEGNPLLLDTATDRPLGAPLRHPWPVTSVGAFSPDGRVVATGSHPQTVTGAVWLWDAATGRPCRPPLPLTNFPGALAFSPDGKTLATGDYHQLVKLWNVATGQLVGRPLWHKDVVLALAFSPDGKTLAAGTADDRAQQPHTQLWDVASGQALGPPLPHRGMVFQVAFSPDGRTLFTASADRTARLWDVATGQPRGEPLPWLAGQLANLPDRPNYSPFSPDGRLVVTVGRDHTALLYDVATGRPLPNGQLRQAAPIRAAAFSPDGRRLVLGCTDGSARLWDVAGRKPWPLGPPVRHRALVLGVAFTPDGRSFLTVDNRGRVSTWPVPAPLAEPDLDRLTLRLEVRTGLHADETQTPLSPEEWGERRQRLSDLEGSAASAYQPVTPVAAWHNDSAHDAKQEGDAFGALWHLDRLLSLQPKDWQLYARRARLRTQAREFDKAAADYARAQELAPGEALLDWYRHRAAACEAAKADDVALWYLERALALQPTADSYAARAALHQRARRWEASLADWMKALAQPAPDWAWYVGRAAVYDRLGKTAEAEADVALALTRGAGLDLVEQTAEARGKAGRWGDAAQLFAAARERGPIALSLWQAWALALLKAGDQDGYRKLCTRLVGTNPASLAPQVAAVACDVVTRGPQGLADWEGLLPVAERLAHGAPLAQRPAILTIRGAVLCRAGRYAEAVTCLEGLEQPDSLDVWVFLALAHHRLGQAEKAAADLARVRAWKPPPAANFRSMVEADLLRQEVEAALREPAGK